MSLEKRLGQAWPSGRDPQAICEDFRAWSDDDDLLVEDTWIFRCHSEQGSGVREFYYYDFDLDRPPILQRIRHVSSAPSGSRSQDWKDLQRTLVGELARASTGTVDWTGSDSGLAFVRSPAYDVSIGLGPNPKTKVLQLEINAYSRRFLDLARDQNRSDTSQTWLPEALPPTRRDIILKNLREQAPTLAAALSRPKPAMTDTTVVFAELRRASRGLDGAPRDLRLFAAHRWVTWATAGLGDDSIAAAQAIDTAIKPFGGSVGESHYGGWLYDEGLRAKLSARRGENRWADEAFLEELDECYSYRDTTADVWGEVLRVGESYLARFPRSAIAPEVVLHMAEANETAWSLSKAEPVADYLDPAAYRLDAQRHRVRALELYEQYLRLRPRSSQRTAIRHRMNRLRLDVDTGFHKYYCPAVC